MSNETYLEIGTILSARTKEGMVELVLNTEKTQMDLDKAREVARRIRAGNVAINHAFDINAPFGGYKHSGNGREWSEFGFHEYLEIKGTLGYAPEKA